jgi:hypothetical protein
LQSAAFAPVLLQRLTQDWKLHLLTQGFAVATTTTTTTIATTIAIIITTATLSCIIHCYPLSPTTTMIALFMSLVPCQVVSKLTCVALLVGGTRALYVVGVAPLFLFGCCLPICLKGRCRYTTFLLTLSWYAHAQINANTRARKHKSTSRPSHVHPSTPSFTALRSTS